MNHSELLKGIHLAGPHPSWNLIFIKLVDRIKLNATTKKAWQKSWALRTWEDSADEMQEVGNGSGNR